MADPTAPAPQTIGDVIAAQLAATATQVAAAQTAAAADAALATANVQLATANGSLAADLAAEGAPVFTVDTNGVVTVYITDTSPAGFHSFVPLPASTALPAPAPAPAVTPTPAATPPAAASA